MRVECPTCGAGLDLDDRSAGVLVRCQTCGKSFVAPSDLSVVGQKHRLTVFSVAGLVLLHFTSLGLFSVVYLNLMHDKLPKIRRGDPSGLTAVGLSFVPLVNLIWFFFTFRRLCVRINEQRRFRGLPQTAPQTLAVIVATLLLVGFAATILPLTGWVLLGTTLSVLIPVFIAVLQASVNELVAYDQARPGRAAKEPQEGHAQPPAAENSLHRHRDLGADREPGAFQGAAGARDRGL